MSNFNINDEIDKTVDKMALQLKSRLKSIVIRGEKQVLRQYMAAQKDTTKTTKNVKNNSDNTKKTSGKRVPKREIDYASTESDNSD
jgi:DNA-binding LytR/AlgR family response regulator